MNSTAPTAAAPTTADPTTAATRIRAAIRRIIRPLAAVGAAVALTAGLAACSTADPIEVTADTVIIDVRTADEYAGGHLDGALNIDVNGGTFEQQVDQLDRDLDYVVYCRSGNRAGTAVSIMQEMGFTSVVNAGSAQSASDATGIAIVTG